MAKNLKTLANQLRKNCGIWLIPTFDDGVRCGTILEAAKWNDVTPIGHLCDDAGITSAALGEVEGPTPCQLPDIKRNHELNLSAALEILKPRGAVSGNFKRAKEVVMNFDSPVTYSLSQIRLEDALEKDPAFWSRTTGERLQERKHYIVTQVFRGRLSFLFRGSGAAGVNLQATALSNLDKVKLGTDWTWRNEATLEAKSEIVFAVEMCSYNMRKQRLVTRK